jgi:hypothetical protein
MPDLSRSPRPSAIIAVVLVLYGARERQIEAEIARELTPKIVGAFIAAHFRACRPARGNSLRPRSSTRIALRARADFEGRNPAKIEITLRRETIRDVPLRVWLTSRPRDYVCTLTFDQLSLSIRHLEGFGFPGDVRLLRERSNNHAQENKSCDDKTQFAAEAIDQCRR